MSERPGELERCEATVEIRKDGSVVTFFEGRELVSEFLFKERQWPRSCIIEVRACMCVFGGREGLSYDDHHHHTYIHNAWPR